MPVRRSRRRKHFNIGIIMAVIAALSFIAAVSIYFAGSLRDTEREYAVYSTLEEPSLPVVYADINGTYANAMHGYMQEMGNEAAADSITPLPEDRKLGLKISAFDNTVTELSYEIRSLDLEHYIERTVVEVPQKTDDGDIYATLPVQNMIERDTPYLLKIRLVMGEKTVNYYTRIIWTDNSGIFNMLETAEDFTRKTFDRDNAKELTVYLESSESADNSSFESVGINSSFSQITWGDSGMQLMDELQLVIKEYDGMMGAVEISYKTQSPGADGENPDIYDNTDEFTMRAGSDRIYMMNYKRSTNQIFDGSKHLFTGNRIRLGIISKDRLQTLKSENGRFIVFKADKELWSYDQKNKRAVNVFSFRSGKDSIRASYNSFDIKILTADDEGNVDFAVYGYMNRGRHEGYNGIAYYHYNSQSQSIEEVCFIPVVKSFERIALEVSELCTENSTGVNYVKQNDMIYAIDGNSQEIMTVASLSGSDSYAVSRDQTKIAWIEGDVYSTNSIKLTDLTSGNTNTVNAEEGKVLTILGFCNNDLIYGERSIDDNLTVNGRIKGRPVYAIHIVDSELNSIMDYHKDGLWFDEVRLEGDRIQLAQYRKNDENGSFSFVSRDTIVSSEPEQELYTNYISSQDSETKKRQYYLNLDETIKTTRNLEVTTPDNISYEKSGSIELTGTKKDSSFIFYAYANGKLAGRSDSLKGAIDLCYDEIGWVKDADFATVYNRADRSSAYTIKEPNSVFAAFAAEAADGSLSVNKVTDSGYLVLDAQGIELNRLMYYVGKGIPVMAALDDNAYCLIYAYDRTSIGIFYPAENDELSTRVSMTTEEAAAYFAGYSNDFTCFIRYPGK